MNAYSNQAFSVPPPARGQPTVGQRVNTSYGVGIITDVRGTYHRGCGARLDPMLATIFVPGPPACVFTAKCQTLIFTENAVGGEVSIPAQFNNNL